MSELQNNLQEGVGSHVMPSIPTVTTTLAMPMPLQGPEMFVMDWLGLPWHARFMRGSTLLSLAQCMHANRHCLRDMDSFMKPTFGGIFIPPRLAFCLPVRLIWGATNLAAHKLSGLHSWA
jgi:hypothetical protein